MPRTRPKARRRAKDIATLGFWEGLKEVSLFFQGKDEVHKSMRRIAKRLEKAGIPYAIAGGMAVFAHKYRRTTADVDVLLTREGLEQFRAKFVGRTYRQKEGRPRRFVDKVNNVGIDFLVTGLFPGSGKPGPIAYPPPDAVGVEIGKVQILNLRTLVELKLAARRHQDFADVVNMIRFNDLDESFAAQLHPSVRRDYIECLEEKRREDEYEAREG
jgi:hypothetical protein